MAGTCPLSVAPTPFWCPIAPVRADKSGARTEAGPYGRPVRIFRATVRGQFDGLDDDRKAALRAEAEEHDLLATSFTREGSFAYSPALTWLNLRYEVRHPDGTADEEVERATLAMARDRLERLEVPHKHLRVELLDMATMWDDR
jgi:hypothetical protein